MKYYAIYNNLTKELSKANCKCIGEEIENIEITQEIFNSLELYKYENGQIIRKSDEEIQEERAQQRKEHINSLTCTKRDFALMLQHLGVTYQELKQLIATNEQAQLEWDLCIELYRNNPLLDIMCQYIHITPEKLDEMFLYVNGEINDLTPIESAGENE